MAKTKRVNPVFRYFVHFGLRQLSDILILVASILIIIGMVLSSKVGQVVVVAGLACYVLASVLAIFRCVKVMTSGANKRSPEYRSAFANAIFMGIILVIAVFALLMGVFWYFG